MKTVTRAFAGACIALVALVGFTGVASADPTDALSGVTDNIVSEEINLPGSSTPPPTSQCTTRRHIYVEVTGLTYTEVCQNFVQVVVIV